MSEKLITRQQAGLVRRAKTSCRNPVDLAGACSGGKLVVSRAGEAYDARDGGPNRKFRPKHKTRRMAGASRYGDLDEAGWLLHCGEGEERG